MEAWDNIALVFDIIGENVPSDVLKKKEDEIKEGLMLQTLGTLMHAFASESAQARVRTLILPHLKELRTLVGRDQM